MAMALEYNFHHFPWMILIIIINYHDYHDHQAIALVASVVVGVFLWTRKKKSLTVISMNKVNHRHHYHN